MPETGRFRAGTLRLCGNSEPAARKQRAGNVQISFGNGDAVRVQLAGDVQISCGNFDAVRQEEQEEQLRRSSRIGHPVLVETFTGMIIHAKFEEVPGFGMHSW